MGAGVSPVVTSWLDEGAIKDGDLIFFQRKVFCFFSVLKDGKFSELTKMYQYSRFQWSQEAMRISPHPHTDIPNVQNLKNKIKKK